MRFKITVLKKMSNPELADQYLRNGAADSICRVFTEGQEFIMDFDDGKPADFCTWAWGDIHGYLRMFMTGGDMGERVEWMKDDRMMITCCSDGIRPVIFKIEVIEP